MSDRGMPSIHSSVMTSRAHAVPIDLRHEKIVVAMGVFGEFRRRRRLQAEVHFDLDRAGQGIDHSDRIEPLRLDGEPLRLTRGEKHVAEIAPEATFDAGPKHLDRHRFLDAVLHDLGSMDLRDRSGGDGLAQFGKEIAERPSERLFDDVHGDVARKRLHPVLKRFEFARDSDADDIGPGRQGLAELDVGRSELGDRRGEPRHAAAPTRQQPGKPERRPSLHGQGGGVDAGKDAFTRQNEAGAAQANDMTNRGEHARNSILYNFQPE